MGKSPISCFSHRHCERISKTPMKLTDPSHLLQRDWQCVFLMQSVENRPGTILHLCPKLIGRTEQKKTSKHPLLLQKLSQISKGSKGCYWTPKASRDPWQQNRKQKKMPENPSPLPRKEATHEESLQMHWYTHLLGTEGTLRHRTQWTSWFC